MHSMQRGHWQAVRAVQGSDPGRGAGGAIASLRSAPGKAGRSARWKDGRMVAVVAVIEGVGCRRCGAQIDWGDWDEVTGTMCPNRMGFNGLPQHHLPGRVLSFEG